MITEYYLKIVQAGKGYNYTVKFYLDGECICGEGYSKTQLGCMVGALWFKYNVKKGVK